MQEQQQPKVNNTLLEHHLIPFGLVQEEYQFRHLINKDRVPYSNNVDLDLGTVRKRTGRTEVYDFTEEAAGMSFLGAHTPNSDVMLLFFGVPTADPGAQTGKVFEWNLIPDPDDDDYLMTDITPAGGLHNSAKWRCVTYFAQSLGQTITACTNGQDHILKYVHSGGTSPAIGYMETLISSGDIASGDYFKGQYLAYFFSALYVGNITDDGTLNLSFEGGKEFSSGVAGIATADTVTGQTSGATATVGTVTVDSGTWAAGTAAGDFDVSAKTGNFVKGEALTITRATVEVEDIATTDGCVNDPYAIVWSQIGDTADFTVTEYYAQRTEGGKPINGLMVYNDNYLILSKGGNEGQNQLWFIRPYSNFECPFDKIGFSNFESAAIVKKMLYFNDKGKIIDLEQNELTMPIKVRFSSADAGSWDVHTVYNEHQNELICSIGRSMFRYDFFQQTWKASTFDRDVRVIGLMWPGRPAQAIEGTAAQRTAISVAEEDTFSDPVYIYNNSVLCVQNHFSTDNGKPITIAIETPTIPVTGDLGAHGRVRCISLTADRNEGGDVGPVTVRGFFSDSPTDPVWEDLGTITFNDQGYGELWIDKRAIWCALYFTETSTRALRLYKPGILFQRGTRR